LKVGSQHISDARFKELAEEISRLIRETLGDNLVSLALFGSVARGDFHPGSDVDLIVVCKELPDGFLKRIDMLMPVFNSLEKNQAYAELKPQPPFIQFYPLTTKEAAKARPIFLDVITDGVLLYDRGEFMENVLKRMKSRLDQLGAKKVPLKNGSWMWMLKPDIELGEVIEV